MLSLNVERTPMAHITTNGDIGKDTIINNFNGLPVVRAPKELGRRGLTNKTIVVHPSGIKLSKVPNGYIILCSYSDCGAIGSKEGIRCVKHAETYRYCRQPGCGKRANFGYEKKKSLYCADHKLDDMMDVIHKKCASAGCDTLPYFGFKAGPADYCSKHKLEGMIDVIHKRCIHSGCMLSPSFGTKGGPPQYCSTHKPAEHIDVTHKRCIVPECMIVASFGTLGEPRKYCTKHKLDGMINFSTKKCAIADCMTVPSFGTVGGSPEYCKRHKLEGMINVKEKRCLFSGCMVCPCFGFVGDTMEYCNQHKQEGMVNLRNKKCIHPECMIRARFGISGLNPEYCSEHKPIEMVNLSDKKCCATGCNCRPSYGLLFSTGRTHCKPHATLNHYMDQKRNPICNELKCYNRALFVAPGDITVYPVRCSEHKIQDDTELVNRFCPNCEELLYYPSNQEYCMDCGEYREILISSARETTVEYMLQSANIDFIHDKRISQHGSRHRPDFRIPSNFGFIVVEVDENQHNKHLEYDEYNRMKTIYHDVQYIAPGKQVLFIRYNPDKYDSEFIFDDKKRLEYLHLVITSMKTLPTIGTPLGYVRLFYDGFTGAPAIESLDTIIDEYDDDF